MTDEEHIDKAKEALERAVGEFSNVRFHLVMAGANRRGLARDYHAIVQFSHRIRQMNDEWSKQLIDRR